MKIINEELSSIAFVSVSPVVLQAPNRPVNLQMRISAPVTGTELPIILLSHGHGNSNFLSSMLGCAPLADFWAAHGFVVIQPTHLNSKTVNVDRNGPEGPLFWRSRVEDMKLIIDHLDDIESIVPALSGRLDKNRIAIAGYSLGGHTAAMLLGILSVDALLMSLTILTGTMFTIPKLINGRRLLNCRGPGRLAPAQCFMG